MKKIISIVLIFSMLLGLNITTFASEGTESNPYVIETPDDLQNMRDDLSGHYVLANDIDMTDYWYEPVGNELDGAFAGSLDGNGYTISNLDLDLEGSKYVGLFGYLDGTVKDVNLEITKATGYRYVGSVAGYVGENGEIYGCTVSGGEFEGKYVTGYIYIGGVAGYNKGNAIIGCTNNNLVSSSSSSYVYTGGIVGYNNCGMMEYCANSGSVSASSEGSYVYAGGVVGYNENGTIRYSTNSITISANSTQINNSYAYAGGIVGYNENGTIEYSANSGSVSSSASSSDYNSAGSRAYAGGMVGYNKGELIKCCTNSGKIFSKSYDYASNVQNVHAYAYAGGIVGANSEAIIECCDNIAFIEASSNVKYNYDSYVYAGGIVGINSSGRVTYCYSINYKGSNGTQPTINEFKDKENFEGFDFENEWMMDSKINSGFPTLRNLPENIVLNECILAVGQNEIKTLQAFINGADEDVTWSSDDESIAVVSENGEVKGLNFGTCTISAVNDEGLRANCCVTVYDKASEMSIAQEEYNVTIGKTVTPTTVQAPNTTAEAVYWTSSDTSIATVDKYTGAVKGVKNGSVTITATTILSGVSASCTVNVTGSAVTKLVLSATSKTMNVNDTFKLGLTITPSSNYDTRFTWVSSDENIATVDETGLVTAKYPGAAYISVTAASGITTQCLVTVKAPSTELSINKPEITLEKGYTDKILPVMLPEYTTDTITYASSNTGVATVTADGTVTAKAIGQAIITVQTTSGLKQYCNVYVVTPNVSVTSVTLDKTEHIMTLADTVQMNATVLPTNATNKSLTWISSDANVAEVNSTGVVTAKGVGVATITATANNGMYHECVIKVISASGPSVVLTSESAEPGGMAEVKASILRNPGISSYKFTVDYDASLLTPVSITANEDFGGTFTTNLEDENRTELNVLWYAKEDISTNGDLFTVTFKVNDNVAYDTEGAVAICYGAKDICNVAGESIALYVQNTSVKVEEPLPGDIYEDKEITVYDLTLLARYITGLESFTDRQKVAANVTDDELVDIKDVVKLAQYIVGWSGVELMSLMSIDDEAAETPVVSVGTASVNELNEAEIPVYIKNNAGIAGYRFVLNYNAEDIEILSITPTELINKNNFGTNLGQENDEGLIVSCWQEGDVAADGELFTIKVRYKNTAADLVSPISIAEAENNFCNQDIENVLCTYETGYALGDDYIVANKALGDTNFSCELYFDDSYAEQSAKAIIAFYDDKGRMLQLGSSDTTVKPGRVDVSIDYDKKDYSTYKLMIWEDMGTLKPITNAK